VGGALVWLAIVIPGVLIGATHWSDLTANLIDQISTPQNLVLALVSVSDHQSAARVRPRLCRQGVRRGSARDGNHAARVLAGALCRRLGFIGLRQ